MGVVEHAALRFQRRMRPQVGDAPRQQLDLAVALIHAAVELVRGLLGQLAQAEADAFAHMVARLVLDQGDQDDGEDGAQNGGCERHVACQPAGKQGTWQIPDNWHTHRRELVWDM